MVVFIAIILLMTTAATAAIVWPFLSGRVAERSGSDLEVYRDQLKELERDHEAGLISSEDAEAARVEVSRRLLSVARRAKADPAQADLKTRGAARRFAFLMALIAVPVLSAGMYIQLGSPGLREEVIGGASSPGETQTIERMIARVETHLQQNPNDGRGWEVLAPVYAKLGRYHDSVAAWRAAIDHLGENADRLQGLGESLVAAANGIVTPEAKKVFDQTLALDSSAVAAKYYRGLAAKQDGSPDEAAEIWRDLIASAPPGAAWVGSVRAALSRLAASPAGNSTPPPPPSPSNAAAADETNAMIHGMVAKLAERLSKDGGDAEAWLRLVRSYAVLGDKDKALAAIAGARRNIGSDQAQLRSFEDGISKLGLAAN